MKKQGRNHNGVKTFASLNEFLLAYSILIQSKYEFVPKHKIIAKRKYGTNNCLIFFIEYSFKENDVFLKSIPETMKNKGIWNAYTHCVK